MTDMVTTTESKDRNWKITRDCLLEGILYLAVFLVTALLYFTLKPFVNVYRVAAVAKGFMAILLGACGVFIAYMGATKRLKARHIAMMILVVVL